MLENSTKSLIAIKKKQCVKSGVVVEITEVKVRALIVPCTTCREDIQMFYIETIYPPTPATLPP